ncbi:MAG: tetratricopeptide repeat protein [Verrucomicrobiota bacterium]|jgi:tetratricopeptide (TPR) repeat protein
MAASELQKCPAGPDGKWTVLGVCVLLAVAVFVVFGQTLRHEFVSYDDYDYFSSNYHVKAGVTWNGAQWAFRTGYASNWHPLTWLSLMLDVQLFGTGPAGLHLMNVLLHAANAVLLFLLLRRMMGLRSNNSIGAPATTAGTLWSSAFVAAIFAIHPLHVESVAWVAERKDVLSGLFFLLTLLMYARYAQKRSKVESQESRTQAVPALDSRPWTLDYGLALLFFALGLMSKPMLVTVPLVLLLLDWWPLERFTIYDLRFTIRRLIWEKIPFFGLSAASCVATVLAQQEAIRSTIAWPLTTRLANALISYVTYIAQTVWPDNLAVFYPYRFDVPVWQIAGAGGLLLSVTVLMLAAARRFPYLLVGWLWYLGMLVPVIGLVQVGDQSHADRYTYLPQIGLSLVIVWAVKYWTASWRWRHQVLGVAAGSVIVALLAGSWRQTSYWRNSESLWAHTLACTSDNSFAHMNMGVTLTAQDRLDEAIEHFQKALKVRPDYAECHNNLGVALRRKGQVDEAIMHFQKALEIHPDHAEIHNGLGFTLVQKGQVDEAIAHYQEAIQLEPDYAEAHYNLANMLAKKGQFAEAIVQYQKAIQLNPDYAEAHYNLGAGFGLRGRLDEAVEQYRKAIQIKPDYADAHGNLANVLATQGKLDEAVKAYRRLLELAPNSGQAHFRFGQVLQARRNFPAAAAEYQQALNLDSRHLSAHLSLAWLLATCPEATLRDGGRAVELARAAEQLGGGESPQILDTLAAAYAEAGQFGEAVETAKRALNLTATQNNQPLAEAIQARLKFYEANAPFHEKP